MNQRTQGLRRASLDAVPTISSERAELLTAFYRAESGRHSVPVMRAKAFHFLCEHKTLFLGDDELIVGERGPAPKVTPTYPELTCHTLEDLRILDSRPKTSYRVPQECLDAYEREVIPFWHGRSLRDRIFAALPGEWHQAYEAGIFTEFMEQRAPGSHGVWTTRSTTGALNDFKVDINASIEGLDFHNDPEALDKREALTAMAIACDAVILFARGMRRRPRTWRRSRRIRPGGPNSRELPGPAGGSRRTPRGIFTRRCSPTGSATLRSSRSSTGGMPSIPAIWTSTFSRFTGRESQTAA